MSWRYLATRLNGDGTETVIDPEVPLSGVSITESRNAPTEISGTISPEYPWLIDDNGIPLLEKWSTAIYAEEDDEIRAGGIYVDDSISGQELQIDVMGFSGYPNGQCYTEGNSWPIAEMGQYPTDGIEPMDAVREIWRHLQAQTMGNLGITITGSNTNHLIGKLVAEGEFDTVNGPLAFEWTPFLLRDFETFDLGDTMSNLCENTPLEFIEENVWDAAHENVIHTIRFGYPGLGRRRQDLTFVIGDNVNPVPIDPPENEYLSTVLGLGSGEGAAMIRSLVSRSGEHRIRRAGTFEDKSANTAAAISVSANAELRSRIGVDEVSNIDVRPEHVDTFQGLMVGDQIRLTGDQPHRDVDMWVRVQTKTRTPDTGALSFGVTRVDRLA